MDPIQLEILWSNLISIVSEQSKSLQRVAFSPIVREAGDLATAMFDPHGRMVAQAVTGTPGHINSLGSAGKEIIKAFPPDALKPGDVLITNDPWLSAGHFFDITIFSPVFFGERIIAYFGSTIHHTDIGGYGIGAGARDVHEEGLWIPVTKLYDAGKPNETLHKIIQHNVRTPDAVFGDLAAQMSSGMIAGERLVAFCKRQNLTDLEEVSNEIIGKSEAATRESVRQLKGGIYSAESIFDVPGGEEITLKVKLEINTERGEIVIDFGGSSGASEHGFNVVLNYTMAYSNFAIRSLLNPDLPNNSGSLAPVIIKAPKGCILNAEYPSPVNARHVVGMYVPMPIMKALYQAIPERVIAESSGAVWTVQVQGRNDEGKPFTSSMFNYSGGMGARAQKDGLSATCYPTGVAAVPVEVLEASVPIEFICKELILETGGKGRQNGGDGQRIGFRMRTGRPWLLNAIPSRMKKPAEGIAGGGNGKLGKFLVNGQQVNEARKLLMQPDDTVVLETPGGGAYG
jgi:N-methylhydantoinase B/oxoprolinase/acetone carboxylase alpha subunit